MRYSIAFLAAVAAVQASPFPRPQAVTEAISPSDPAPSGCSTAWSGSFGIVVQNVTMGGEASVTQMSDGQPAASSAPVSEITDGQPQASTGGAPPVTQISDGQPQASTGAAPPVTQISDGQVQGPTGAVSQIGDGQIQAPKTMNPVTQISDGQIQATMPVVSQISDGQIQAPTAPAVSEISDGQPQAPTATEPAATQISDGQIQGPTAPAVTEISDGQPQATGGAVSEISDGQPQATTGVGEMTDGQPTATAGSESSMPSMVACMGDGVLSMTLEDGILTDDQGRIGYIASNYQFQFDGPPQAGAIYTAGWSVCGNGSLTLGGNSIFYQCLSGDFYNLYNENWASQCNAVTIDALELIDCASK